MPTHEVKKWVVTKQSDNSVLGSVELDEFEKTVKVTNAAGTAMTLVATPADAAELLAQVTDWHQVMTNAKSEAQS